jgi:hypothetical protein
MKTAAIESMSIYIGDAVVMPFVVYGLKITSYLYFSLILCIILNGWMFRLKSQKRRIKMKVFKRKLKLKVLFGTFIIMIFSMNTFSYILLNGSGKGYPSGDGDKGIINNLSIEMYVVQGSGYFLEGNSCIQSILNRVELQDFNGIDYNELVQLVHRAFFNIILARLAYEQLIQLAELTPYNHEFISKLKTFDYESFMTNMGLNLVVFGKVMEYLEKGNITGTFKHTYSNLIAIEDLLTDIKNEISVDRIPELSLLRKLNETCAEVSMFGSYAARVFHALR